MEPLTLLSPEHTVLVTGATGKVGRALVARLTPLVRVRALCHSRSLEEPGVDVVRGDMSVAADVARAVDGVTHVVHLATCKETPDAIMDVAVKGLFWLLEACRTSPAFEQLVLIGGDASIGHAFYERQTPITETTPHAAYPGCYALSKVLEEVMVEQYGVQYGLNTCCLRAPWLMEKDDFRFTLSFGDDVFGGPRWCDLVGPVRAGELAAAGALPLGLGVDGAPLRRSFLHVSDLVEAIVAALGNPAAERQLFNIAMDEPLDYGVVAHHLAATHGLPIAEVETPMHSVWLDNAKARSLLGWRPQYDAIRLASKAFAYVRADNDPRHIFYPG